MRKGVYVLGVVGILCAWPLTSHALDFHTKLTRGQLGHALIGLTIIEQCPTEEIVGRIMRHGEEEYRADMTVIARVAGQTNCPANFWGQVLPSIGETRVQDGFSFGVSRGVTVGLHYRLTDQ